MIALEFMNQTRRTLESFQVSSFIEISTRTLTITSIGLHLRTWPLAVMWRLTDTVSTFCHVTTTHKNTLNHTSSIEKAHLQSDTASTISHLEESSPSDLTATRRSTERAAAASTDFPLHVIEWRESLGCPWLAPSGATRSSYSKQYCNLIPLHLSASSCTLSIQSYY